MFELDEVQSHTPSPSSSLQAVCLCVRPLGRLCVCVVCQSRQQTVLSSRRSLLLEHFLFCRCWTSGYQWKHTQLSYVTFCSWTWKGEISNFLLRNLILQIVGLSLIRHHSLNNFSSCVKEYPIKTGNIVYCMYSWLRVLPGNTRGRVGFVHCLLWLSDFSQLIPNPQTIQLTVDKNSLFHYHEHFKLYVCIHYCLLYVCIHNFFFLKKLILLFRKDTSNWSKSDTK